VNSLNFETVVIEIAACIKGYHAYRYQPDDMETLAVNKECNNTFDRFAVGVYSKEHLIGHVPVTPTPLNKSIWHLLDKYAYCMSVASNTVVTSERHNLRLHDMQHLHNT
jgi:hypothetical protein